MSAYLINLNVFISDCISRSVTNKKKESETTATSPVYMLLLLSGATIIYLFPNFEFMKPNQ